jgi:hypothetical protein
MPGWASCSQEFLNAKTIVHTGRCRNQRLCFIGHPGNRQSPCRWNDQRKRHCPGSQRRSGPESARLALQSTKGLVPWSPILAPASSRLSGLQLPLPALPLWLRRALRRFIIRYRSPASPKALGLGLILVTGVRTVYNLSVDF